jgi:hypothetical protein
LPDLYAILTLFDLDFSMHIMDERRNSLGAEPQAGLQIAFPPGAAALRRALRGNIVSFPSQIPILMKQPAADMQWRMVLLFFLRGWSAPSIAARFHVPKHRIRKSLNDWSVRALALGYIQVIDQEAFAACCHPGVEEAADLEVRQAAAKPTPGEAGETLPEAVAIYIQALPSPEEIMPKSRPGDTPGGNDMVGALDAAIAHCEEWRGDFWMRMATLLRDVRTAAVVALDLRRPSGPTDSLFSSFPAGEGSLQQGLQIREEERVYHAVA